MIKYGNKNIKSIIIHTGEPVSIDKFAMNQAPVGDIVLDDSVSSIPENAFRNKPITSISGENVTSIASQALNGTKITSITDENFPKLGVSFNWYVLLRLPSTCRSIKLSGEKLSLGSGSGALRYCYGLVTAEFPNANKNSFASNNNAGNYCMGNCTNLELADLGFVPGIGANVFNGDSKFSTLIIRKKNQIVSLSNISAFTGTKFANGGSGGTIYIPKVMYDHLGDGGTLDYKAATNWVTVDGYGTITWAKIEGSEWELDS